MSTEPEPEYGLLSLDEHGEQTRIKTILDKRERADEAITRRDELAPDEVYKFVQSYIREFEAIAAKQNHQQFLNDTELGQLTESDAQAAVQEVHADEATLEHPDRYPVQIRGAESFVDLNGFAIKVAVTSGELSSKTDTVTVGISVPVRISQTAFREAERYRARVGLELDPGVIDEQETDPF